MLLAFHFLKYLVLPEFFNKIWKIRCN